MLERTKQGDLYAGQWDRRTIRSEVDQQLMAEVRRRISVARARFTADSHG